MVALLYSKALTSFLDEKFTKLYKILVVKKSKSVHEEVIDCPSLSYGRAIYKISSIDI